MDRNKNNSAFIDSQNLNLGIRALGWKLDFARFRQYLADKFGVKAAFLFIGYKPGNEGLYESLQSDGYTCIFKPTMTLPDGTVKGNVDAELVLHTMIQYPNFDKAVIVTGDGDFHCLVSYLIDQNKFERLVIPNIRRCSKLLRGLSTEENCLHVYADELKERLEKR